MFIITTEKAVASMKKIGGKSMILPSGFQRSRQRIRQCLR
jgi:hypothetical protein